MAWFALIAGIIVTGVLVGYAWLRSNAAASVETAQQEIRAEQAEEKAAKLEEVLRIKRKIEKEKFDAEAKRVRDTGDLKSAIELLRSAHKGG